MFRLRRSTEKGTDHLLSLRMNHEVPSYRMHKHGYTGKGCVIEWRIRIGKEGVLL